MFRLDGHVTYLYDANSPLDWKHGLRFTAFIYEFLPTQTELSGGKTDLYVDNHYNPHFLKP